MKLCKMITRLSPAKINLLLHVLRKRPDGYHDIATLMQKVSLCDEMTFAPVDRGISLHCHDCTLPDDRNNIVYRAAEAIFTHQGYTGGIDISIKKRIPVAAGLGGGSSNAATALLVLNEMMEFGLSANDLMSIGVKLGADVPFFIFGRTAWALGIGEKLQQAEGMPEAKFLLINPGFELSTKTVYEGLNLRLTNETIHYSIPRFYKVHDLAARLHNDLEKVSLHLYPLLRNIKELLIRNGALGALMSGSGPTVFGLFEDESAAIDAEKTLQAAGKWSIFRVSAL